MRELAGGDVSPSAHHTRPRQREACTAAPTSYARLLVALTVIVLLASAGAAWQGWFPWQQRKQMTNARHTPA